MKMRVLLLDADYVVEEGKAVVRLWGVEESGKRVFVFDSSLKPYFYVQPAEELSGREIEELAARIMNTETDTRRPENVEAVGRKLLGKPKKFLKITMQLPADVPKLRDVVKEWKEIAGTYEYSIPFARRYHIDRKLYPLCWLEVEGETKEAQGMISIAASKVSPGTGKGLPELRVMAFDIETVDGEREEIIMVSMESSGGWRRVITAKGARVKNTEKVAGEKELVARFMELVKERDPDIIVTYNGDRFDFVKMQQAAQRHKLPLAMGRDGSAVEFKRKARISAAGIAGRVHADLFDFVESIMAQTLTSEVLTLDKVARELLGFGKQEMEWSDIKKAWESGKGMSKVIKYCQDDSTLTIKLAERLLPLIFGLSRTTGLAPFEVSRVSYSQLVESLLMREAFELGEVILSQPGFQEAQRRRLAESYEGGYVHVPEKGIHESIAVFDFASLYPSIIVSYNISPETINCGHDECKSNRAPSGEHYFCTRGKGFIPRVLERILKERAEAKRRAEKEKDAERQKELYSEQFALKILANSFYGYLGYPNSRWYSRICAETTAAIGRFYIKQVIDIAKGRGMRILYGDTDSLFSVLETRKKAVDFVKEVNASLPGIMELEFKDIYKRGIFIESKTAGRAAKKKYALLDRSDRLIMRGMETRRRDWAKIAKDTQEEILYSILRDKSIERAVDIVRERIEKLKEGKAEKRDLIIYTELTKPVKEYEQVSPHVMAAIKMMQRGKNIGEGAVIGYIITKGVGSISERAEEAEAAKDYDPDYYVNNQLLPAAMRILSNFGVTEEDILSGKQKQYSLEGFWKGK